MEADMKVLVHLNHGIDKSVMMDFGNKLDVNTLMKMVNKGGVQNTVESLVGYARVSSIPQVEIKPTLNKLAKAESQCDVMLSQHRTGYVLYAAPQRS